MPEIAAFNCATFTASLLFTPAVTPAMVRFIRREQMSRLLKLIKLGKQNEKVTAAGVGPAFHV